MEAPQKTRSRDTIPGLISKGIYIYPKDTIRIFTHLCLLQHYSQLPNFGNNPDALKLMTRLRKCGIYT
jgi:hypothetical protein